MLEEDPEVKYVASSAGTTPEDLLTSGAPPASPTNKRTVRYSQEIVVENLHTTVTVCVFSVAAASACTSDADASCVGGADPKPVVPPGKSRKFRYSGTRNVCAVTSASTGKWQAERLIKKVGDR